MMLFVSRLCTKKILLWLMLLNLLSILFLLLNYDVFNRLPSSKRRAFYKSAYERWKLMRDSWPDDSFNNKTVSIVSEDDGYAPQYNMDSDIRGLSLKEDTPLDFIPRVPKHSISDLVPYLIPSITEPFLRLPDGLQYSSSVVILTPVCDVAGQLEGYAKLLRKLSYPRKLMSVFFGEDSSTDETFKLAEKISAGLKADGFRSAGAFHFNISGGLHGSWGDIHQLNGQYERRSHIAKSRNLLCKNALKDEDFVLWIDSDISDVPHDLVQQLIFGRKHVIAASCLFKSGPYKRNYDKNTWRETEHSLKHQRRLPDDYLIVEGYSDSERIFLPDLRKEGRVVPIDGVGGCTLLVNATCHRNGLIFPEKIYKNHIETEGLAKMAKEMGYSVYGMPFVEIFH